MKNFLKNFIALLIGCTLTLVILEITLILYNPFDTRIKGNRIILPSNKEYIIHNSTLTKLEKTIIHTKNSLGFRGEDLPDNFHDYLSIVSIGGSTTECKYLSDDKTWTAILAKKLSMEFDPLWVNNAGLDGHSTFGHIILVKDYISSIKPTIALFCDWSK